MFQDGDGVDINYEEAMKWYRMAADKGNVQAEKDLGDLYMDMSVPPNCRNWATGEVSLGCHWLKDPQSLNEVEAVKSYLRASESGHPGAMNNLARMFEFGWGVKKDCNAARKWFEKAVAAGNQAARENLRLGGGGECRWR